MISKNNIKQNTKSKHKNKRYLMIPLKARKKSNKKSSQVKKHNREMVIVNSKNRRPKGSRIVDINRKKRKRNQTETVEILGEIPGQIERIEYERTGKHPGSFQHTFDSPSTMYALSNGSVLISSENNIPLWLEGNPKKRKKRK